VSHCVTVTEMITHYLYSTGVVTHCSSCCDLPEANNTTIIESD